VAVVISNRRQDFGEGGQLATMESVFGFGCAAGGAEEAERDWFWCFPAVEHVSDDNGQVLRGQALCAAARLMSPCGAAHRVLDYSLTSAPGCSPWRSAGLAIRGSGSSWRA
jgi:hypothetical protein